MNDVDDKLPQYHSYFVMALSDQLNRSNNFPLRIGSGDFLGLIINWVVNHTKLTDVGASENNVRSKVSFSRIGLQRKNKKQNFSKKNSTSK